MSGTFSKSVRKMVAPNDRKIYFYDPQFERYCCGIVTKLDQPHVCTPKSDEPT